MPYYLFGSVLLGLTVLLGWIVWRIAAMIRRGDPWLAVGGAVVERKVSAPRAKPERQRARPTPKPKAKFKAKFKAVQTRQPGEETPDARSSDAAATPTRRRVLGRVSDMPSQPAAPSTANLASRPAIAVPPPEPPAAGEEYAAIERRLERAFELVSGDKISPTGYSRILASERAAALARLAKLRELDWDPVSGPQTEADLLRAVEAIDWCVDWARGLNDS